MTRPLIVATHCSLLSTAYLTGCGVVCRGPACADEWDIGRVSVLPGSSEAIALRDAEAEASQVWTGSEAEGADWSVDGGDGELVIGTPASSQVWRLPIDGEGGLTGTPWTDGSSFGFGTAVARSGGATWVGNPEADLARGALVRYPAGADVPDVVIAGSSAGDRLGERIWVCGDLDGDAIDEIAVSIPWFATPAGDSPTAPSDVPALSGALLVVYSTELATDANRPIWELGSLWWGAAAGDAFGAGATCAHDLDGDGVADVAVGAPYTGTEDDGSLLVFSGATRSPGGPAPEVAEAVLVGSDAGWLGFDVGTIHETSTGRTLLTAGAPGTAQGAGAVWIVAVSPGRAERQVLIEADETAAGFHVGRFVTHGDTNADGRDDLIIGAPDWKEGKNGYDAGRIFVVNGGPSWRGDGLLEPDTTWTATQPFARLGRRVRAIDLDGDGADDLLAPTRTAILRRGG